MCVREWERGGRCVSVRVVRCLASWVMCDGKGTEGCG
jgi:hypothetical protein